MNSTTIEMLKAFIFRSSFRTRIAMPWPSDDIIASKPKHGDLIV